MRNILYSAIVFIGFLQTIGYVTKIDLIKNLGVVTTASPLPIVFTEVKGVETFASDFYMQWTNEKEKLEQVKITPAIYSKLKGPYNRRNIFGAAIAYGPILPEEILSPVLAYGVCSGVLKNELEIPFDKESFSILIKTRTQDRQDQWTLKTDCNN